MQQCVQMTFKNVHEFKKQLMVKSGLVCSRTLSIPLSGMEKASPCLCSKMGLCRAEFYLTRYHVMAASQLQYTSLSRSLLALFRSVADEIANSHENIIFFWRSASYSWPNPDALLVNSPNSINDITKILSIPANILSNFTTDNWKMKQLDKVSAKVSKI